jgi:cytoskeletal protein CcmA (bactofilin family)
MIRSRRPVIWLTLLMVGAAWTLARAGSEISKVMGSIEVAAGEHSGDLSTVNGSIRIGANAVVSHAHTVSGSISVEPHASAAELTTVNGSIHLQEAARVSGAIHTVNGKLTLDSGADAGGDLKNVNGTIRVAAAHVAGGIDTVTGDIELGPNARIDGGLHVAKDSGSFHFGTDDVPHVIVGPGSVVGGDLRFERPVKLYVSDRATIGRVEGATAVRYSGDQPPK